MRAVGAISLSGIGKVFNTSSGSTTALSGIDLTIASGEAVVLLGPSGCGKTTLLRIIAGLERQSAGTLHAAPGGRLGMVFQEANLFPWFRVADNIALPLRLRGMPAAARDARAAELARLVGLAGRVRVFRVVDEPPGIGDRPSAGPLPAGQGEVVFDDVSFVYPDGRMGLRGLSFVARPRLTLALVGPSGAGKSTAR